MGHVKRRSGSWQAAYRGPDGREHTKTFPLKVEAERWINIQEADLTRGAWIDPTRGKVTLQEYAESWRRIQVHRPTTAAQVETNLRRHVYPHLGSRPIGSLRSSEIQAWVKTTSTKLAPTTTELVYRYLVAVLRAALADGIIARNPAAGVKTPRIDRAPVVPMTTAEVVALIEAVDERYRALVVLAAGTGLRQGECFGLSLPQVDQLRRSLRVDQQLTLLAGAPPFIAPPKTEASHRTVPMPNIVVDAVALHLATYGSSEQGLIFSNNDGQPIRRTRFSANVWRPAVKAAGLRTGTRFHDLRHYYASLLIHAGESVKVVQARLGHATASETLDTYGHLWPDTEDRTRVAVDAVLGGGAPNESASGS